MKQSSIDKEIVHIDYTREDIPASVKNFLPSIYRDGERYHCILGTDKDTGIFGSGNSIEEAIIEWDKSYQEKKRK